MAPRIPDPEDAALASPEDDALASPTRRMWPTSSPCTEPWSAVPRVPRWSRTLRVVVQQAVDFSGFAFLGAGACTSSSGGGRSNKPSDVRDLPARMMRDLPSGMRNLARARVERANLR